MKGRGRSLFWRLWLRSLTVKRPQAALAVASVLVGAAVASMLLNLYGDVRRKMSQEFRAYGPNVVVGPAASSVPTLASNALAASSSNPDTVAGIMDKAVIDSLAPFAQRGNGFAAVPVLYAVTQVKKAVEEADNPSRLEGPENAVAVGADFAALHRLYPSWRLDAGGASLDGDTCVVGAHLASRLRLGRGDRLELSASAAGSQAEGAAKQTYRVFAVLSTGASEDDQVIVPLPKLQCLASLEGKVSLVELSVPGDTAEVERTMGEVNQAIRAFPGVEVRPIRQIVYSSGRVLETIRWIMLSLTGLILVIIALCVMATMTAIVLERRKDIAVMKSLGASDRLVMQLFLTEGATLGGIGGLAGFALGLGLAHEMARRLFSVSLGLTWWTFPTVFLASMMLAVAATLFPVEMVRGIQPARELRGE